jgi:phospholipid N-methyltransferase
LILADTQITDQAVRSLAGMTSIEYLDLTGTHLTQQSADILMQFGHLRHLYVGDSGLTQEMIRRIIEALPQTKVYASRHESF